MKYKDVWLPSVLFKVNGISGAFNLVKNVLSDNYDAQSSGTVSPLFDTEIRF
jgi:hypothetical protein